MPAPGYIAGPGLGCGPGFRYCEAVFAYLPERGEASGYAVVTPRFACLLGPEASVEIARNVFWLLDGPDAQLQDALGTLSHIESIDRFAIVEPLADSRLTVTARGDVTVGIDGTTSARASVSDGALLLTTEATDVRAAWLSLEPGAPAGALLPLYRGIVRTSGLITDAPAGFSATSAAEAELPVAEEPPVTALPVEPEQTMGPQPTPESVAEPESAAEHEAPAEPDAAAEPESDAPDNRVRWVLRLPDGSEVDADGTIIIGRDEWQQEAPGDLIRHVSVPSPQRQISGDHLELALVGDELVARDLHSTNGTIVITAEQPPRLLHKGDTTALRSGDVLDLGESLRIVVGQRA